MTEFTNKLTPTEIASVLQESRPDLLVEFDQHHGGGIKALVATFKDGPATAEDTVYAGIVGGHLGWSDPDGDGGGWAELITSDEDIAAWDNDERITQADVIIARLADILWRRLPPRHPRATKITGAWRVERRGVGTPEEQALAAVQSQIWDLDAPGQVAVLETALDEASRRLEEWEYEHAPKVALEVTERELRLLHNELADAAGNGDEDAIRLRDKIAEVMKGAK